MVKNGQSSQAQQASLPPDLLELSFRNPSLPQLGIECFRLSELRRRMPAGFFSRVQRLGFHLLALYLEGAGREEIDFVAIDCRPGTLLHVHPGQVLRYLDVARAEAQLVLYTPDFRWVPGRGQAVESCSHLELSAAELAILSPGFAALEQEYAQTGGDVASEAILRHLLEALLLQIERAVALRQPRPSVPPLQQEIYQRFRHLLEADGTHSRSVAAYADALGCSARTLNRAALGLAGQPAKRLIDGRVALEAKRLLAQGSLSVAEIAALLDFSEASNFVKFFRRTTGRLPGEFRALGGSQLGG